MISKDQLLLQSLYNNIQIEQQFLTEGLTDNVANWIWNLVQKKFPQLTQATLIALEELVKTKDKDKAADIIIQSFTRTPTNEGVLDKMQQGIRTGIQAATPYVQSMQGLASSLKDLPELLDPQKFFSAVFRFVPDIYGSLLEFMQSVNSGNLDDINDLVTQPGTTILKKVGIAVALGLLAYGAKKYMDSRRNS